MEIKKLNKKGVMIKDIMIVIVGAILIISTYLIFIIEQGTEANQEIPAHLNSTSNSLNTYSRQLEGLERDFENSTASVEEATVGDFAYFGLKGVLGVMKTTIALPSIVANIFNTATSASPHIPSSLAMAISVIILIIIMFSIIKFLTSRGQEP